MNTSPLVPEDLRRDARSNLSNLSLRLKRACLRGGREEDNTGVPSPPQGSGRQDAPSRAADIATKNT